MCSSRPLQYKHCLPSRREARQERGRSGSSLRPLKEKEKQQEQVASNCKCAATQSRDFSRPKRGIYSGPRFGRVGRRGAKRRRPEPRMRQEIGRKREREEEEEEEEGEEDKREKEKGKARPSWTLVRVSSGRWRKLFPNCARLWGTSAVRLSGGGGGCGFG